MKFRSFCAAALIVCSCSPSGTPPAEMPEAEAMAAETAGAAMSEALPEAASARLEAVLAAQPDEVKARYPHRHPKETLEFFGVVPGMTVVDTLPGDVWYTGLLLDYLGADGKVIAADYSPEMWTKFGDYTPDPKTKESWV